MPRFKNIQVIDGADNCSYSIFQATEAEFTALLPEAGQDIDPSAIHQAQRRLFGTD